MAAHLRFDGAQTPLRRTFGTGVRHLSPETVHIGAQRAAIAVSPEYQAEPSTAGTFNVSLGLAQLPRQACAMGIGTGLAELVGLVLKLPADTRV